MREEIAATILIPTTGDRGPLLPLSVGSIQRQRVQNIEIFVIGDGVDEPTRKTIIEIAKSDPRVRFFDHPKDARRGEIYRNEALKEARGEIVCYLCDRDLMLKDHVGRMLLILKRADLAFSHPLGINPDGSIRTIPVEDELRPTTLSMVAHRLDYYRKLPFGWRTTPKGEFTDIYMWQQFAAQADCRLQPLYCWSIIYLPRGSHPGLSTSERFSENKALFDRYIDPGLEDFERHVVKSLIERMRMLDKFKSKLKHLALGLPLGEYLERLIVRRAAGKAVRKP